MSGMIIQNFIIFITINKTLFRRSENKGFNAFHEKHLSIVSEEYFLFKNFFYGKKKKRKVFWNMPNLFCTKKQSGTYNLNAEMPFSN